MVEFKPKAFKELKSFDKPIQEKVFRFLEKLVESHESPRALGIALQGRSKKLWRYRVGDHRLICAIEDHHLIVIVLAVGHRREIYTR